MTGRIVSVARAAGRDLLRRRLGLVLLIAMPLSFYLSVSGGDPDSPGEVAFGFVAATVGLAWSAAGAAFFLSLSARPADERLVLAGYRPSELVAGRLGVLEIAVVLFAAVFAAVITSTMDVERPALLVGAAVASGTVAVPLGLAIAAFFPRELEGALTMMGVIGIQMSVSATGEAIRWLPFAGPVEIASSAGAGVGAIATPALWAALWAAGLLVLALAGWRRGLPRRDRSRTRRWGRGSLD